MALEITHVTTDAGGDHIADIIERDGAVIVDGLMADGTHTALVDELSVYLELTPDSTNSFAGFKTKRIGALMARSPAARTLVMDPLVNALAAKTLGPFCDDYQLHFTQAVSIGKGEEAQRLHRDRGVWAHVPRTIETQLSTIWALTDFTAENGATRVVPGSHTWGDEREPEPHEITCAEMKAGSALIYNGFVLHGGGQNLTDENRVGVLLHYCPNWLRQEENQYLSCPPQIAATLAPDLRARMGYSMGGMFLGFFSSPTGPGEGVELAPPDALFGEDALKAYNAQWAAIDERLGVSGEK